MKPQEELICLAQNGEETAKETLIRENSGLIWSIARRFIGRGTDAEDLYQIGCMGFLKAVNGFDFSYGTQFSTYAVPKISGEIRRFLRDDGVIKVSRTIKEKATSLQSVSLHLAQELGRDPTLSELSERSGLSPEEIAEIQEAMQTTESIQNETGEEGFSLEDILSDTESEEDMLEKLALHEALRHLSERERTVIRLRYFHGLTQDRVAKVLSVSQVQVSRLEKKAIFNLRKKLA